MPKAGGLPDVTQRFDADNSGYTKAADEIVTAAIRMAKENRTAIDDIISSHKDMMAINTELRNNLSSVVAANRESSKAVEDHIRVIQDATHMYANLTNASRDQAIMVREMGRTHSDANAAISDGSKALDDYRKRLELVRKEADNATVSIAAIQKGTADYLAVTTKGKSRDGAGIIDAALASAVAGGGGGGGGGGAAMMAAAAAGRGGGGGGGGWGGAGGFVPWRGGGAQAVRFWGMMTAEIASTVVPALTAAGAAALVGVQGVEQMVPRFKAIFSTSEALGSAMGMTTGKFLGGGSRLQQAQDLATGGAYSIGGSLLSIMQSGAGGGFIAQGTQTVSMLDRGFAQMALNFTKGGTGKKLAEALGGGTGYLRQFGDVGANVGNMLLDLAPNLPGVGSDLLAALSGGTGVLARGARDIPGPLLGGFLSYEAASRWGPALLGGKGLIGRMLGLKGVGGLGGMLGKAGGFLAERAPLGGMLESLGFGMSGAGAALEGIAGWPAGLLGGTAYLMGKGFTAKNLPQQRMAWLQQSVGAAPGLSGAWNPLAHALNVSTGLAATAGRYAGRPGALGVPQGGFTYTDPRSAARVAILRAHDAGIYSAAAAGFATQIGDLTGAAPQLKNILQKMGMKGVSFADAIQIGTNAMLDVTHAFGKHGKLTPQAVQQVQDYARVLTPMTQSPGAFGAAVAAQTIMSQGAMKNVQQVNSAMDSMTNIMTAPATGLSGLFANIKALPTHPMAKALSSFTSPASAAAWNAFASASSSTPGIITQLQGFNDMLRTNMTLGAVGIGGAHAGAQGLLGFQLQKALPMAKQSPAALAMLMQQGAQMGIGGYYDTGKSQAQNYAAAVAATKHIADNAKQANAQTTGMVIKLSNLPQVAKQFAQGTAATIQSQQIAKAATSAMQIKEGVNVKINAQNIVSQLRAAGVSGASALRQSMDAILSQAGVKKALRLKIEGQYFPPHIPKPPNQRFMINGHLNMPPIPHIPNQSFTITGHVVMVGGQVSPYTPAGAKANLGPAAYFHPAGVNPSAYTHLQTGGMVPGSGRGDIIHAMLEPGEAIIPRYLVPLIAPILAAHHVPGFGGVPQSSSSHFAAGGIMPSPKWSHGMGSFPKWGQGPVDISGELGKKFSFKLIDEITKALNSASAKKLATALVNKITQEIQYARSVSAAMKNGLNLGGMDVTPGTGQGTVQEQMQSYLGSLKSFSTDLSALRKGHLNKNLIKQLVDAGPVQGDALAQSILQGPGGIKSVNQLWSQIGGASNKIGAQAAMAQYGGMLAPNLRSGTFVGSGGVSININVNAGQGGNLSLSEAQIKALVAKVQTALLKQAKRNNKTGLQLSGKGA